MAQRVSAGERRILPHWRMKLRRANLMAQLRITPVVLAIGLALVALITVSAAGGADEGMDRLPVRVESLKNPGFEAGTDDWSIAVYGVKPTISADGQTAHEGKQSLRISSSEPSDAALGQELMLAPGKLVPLARLGAGRAASTHMGRLSTARSRSRRRAETASSPAGRTTAATRTGRKSSSTSRRRRAAGRASPSSSPGSARARGRPGSTT